MNKHDIDNLIHVLRNKKLPEKHQMEKEIVEMLKDIGFPRILRELMHFAKPTTVEQASEMVTALQESLSATLAWEGFLHIEDHDGYTCAKRLIEHTTHNVKAEADSHLMTVLKLAGKGPMEKSTNQQTYEEIMKEMDKNG